MNKKLISVITLTFTLCMLFSLAALNVSAASEARTATIELSATTGKEGDTIIANVYLSSTVNTLAMGYRLKFDPNVYAINATSNEDYEAPFCVNTDFMDDYRNLALGKKWGSLAYGADATLGEISVGGSRTTGITTANNSIDLLIGSFTLTVKAGAEAGDTQITLIDATTADVGEGFGAPMIVTPVTFTVEGSVDLVTAPVVETLGAQVRTTAPQGLRFGTKITKNQFFKGIGLTGADKNGAEITDIQYGTLIIPSDYLNGVELTLANQALISYTIADVAGVKIYEENAGYIVFTAVLTEIPEANYNMMFTARAYMKYKLDGVDQIVYFAPIERSVNGVNNSIIG